MAHQSKTDRRAFTLIETLIVVVILGTLATIVTPQFTSARESTVSSTVHSQLQTLRSQIELYNATQYRTKYTIDEPLDTFWDKLLDGDFIVSPPINPLQNSSVVAAAPAPGVGWVWNLNQDGDVSSLSIYAVSETGGWYAE